MVLYAANMADTISPKFTNPGKLGPGPGFPFFFPSYGSHLVVCDSHVEHLHPCLSPGKFGCLVSDGRSDSAPEIIPLESSERIGAHNGNAGVVVK